MPRHPAADALGLDVFYPIVPDADWVARIVPLGARTIQLRLKNAAAGEVRRQIASSMDVCAKHDATLIVNDYWQEALALGAGFVHLGQEDLAAADLGAIKAANVKLGVSTHTLDELDIGLAAQPDYVALGPIYPTKLKALKYPTHGLGPIGVWKARISVPLVAIAGISLDRADGVIDAGADCCAVVTDFVAHVDPEARVREWLVWAARRR
jgi:thiamine-phosphate pyrophosphorylase